MAKKSRRNAPRSYMITFKGFIAAHNDGLIDATPDLVLSKKGQDVIEAHKPRAKKGG